MAHVHLLSSSLSNMIAAGEVVERPASVVKELIENALDAHAHHIDIYIEDAGRKKIEVRDDGIGMDKEDAVMAFKRHATSKIKEKEDLFNIETLGFRGEALPSIAAVSEVTLITSNGEGVGTKVEISGTTIKSVENSNARKGTTIIVKNLFFNTPARLKYLKSDNTEFAQIYDVVSKIALGYPNVIFKLYHNEKESFSTNGRGEHLEIISKTMGYETAKNMIKIEKENFDFKVEGYVSKIQVTKANRYSIIVLINGRYVRVNSVTNAVIDAYKTYIPDGRYPAAILNVEIDPVLVDINVHPAKHEVRLSKENELAGLIKEAVLETLRKDIMPPVIEKKKEKVEIIRPTLELDSPEFIVPKKEVEVQPVTYETFIKEEEIPLKVEESQPQKEEVKEDIQEEKSMYVRAIGQLLGTYIVCEIDEGMFIVDQHAAAERINYEKYQKLLNQKHGTTELLLPLVIEYSYKDTKIILEKKEMLEELGIYVEEFSNTAIRVSEIPLWMQGTNIEVYIKDVIEELLHKPSIDISSIRSHAIASLSCKASIRANHSLNLDDMQNLVVTLLKCENPNTCPHGRPTILKYSKYELEKFFKRVM